MTSSSHRIFFLLLCLVVLIVTACSDDDPVSPRPSKWQEIELGWASTGTSLVSIDFNGGHGLAMGTQQNGLYDSGFFNVFFRLQADGTWRTEDLGNFPTNILFFDHALDTEGNPVLAGAQFSGLPSILVDFRDAGPIYFTRSSRGLKTVDAGDAFLVAGGYAQGGDLWTSTQPGSWDMDDVTPPLTGTNDSGFQDVYIQGDRAVACGFDDGADTLQVILERTTTTEWTKVTLAGPGTRTFQCIALSDEGTIFVGGIEAAGGPSPKAFLAQRHRNGQWTDLILPDPEILHGVEDILLARDGTIYLACMGEGSQTQATLIHARPSGLWKELSFPGGFLQLGEDDNGNIYAVGFRRDDANNQEKAVLMVKTP